MKAGKRVILCDPAPASEATRAAAGMLAPASEVQFCQEALVPLMRRAAASFQELAGQVQQEAGVPVGLRNTRTIVCAFDAADRDYLKDLARYQQTLGLEVRQVSLRAARKVEPALSPALAGAVVLEGDHQINPRLYCTALMKILGDHLWPITATSLKTEMQDGAVRVTGLRWVGRDAAGQEYTGTIAAQHVIVANGLGTQQLEGIAELQELPLRPVHGDVVRLKIPPEQRPLIESTVRGVVRGQPVYLVPREDNTLVLGASSREDALPGISAGGVYQLLRDGKDLLPSLTELEIYEVISRTRPGTPDDIPLIGPLYRNGHKIRGLTVSNGYFRHGILLSARGSELVTRLITQNLTDNDRQDLETCRPQRFTKP